MASRKRPERRHRRCAFEAAGAGRAAPRMIQVGTCWMSKQSPWAAGGHRRFRRRARARWSRRQQSDRGQRASERERRRSIAARTPRSSRAEDWTPTWTALPARARAPLDSSSAPDPHRATRQAPSGPRADPSARATTPDRVTVAPITTTVRGLSTEGPVSVANGLDGERVVSDNIVTRPRERARATDRRAPTRSGSGAHGRDSRGVRPRLISRHATASGIVVEDLAPTWGFSRPRWSSTAAAAAARGRLRRSVTAGGARRVQASQDVRLDLLGQLARPFQGAPPLGRDQDLAGTAILRVRPPVGQPGALKLIDQRDHRARVDAIAKPICCWIAPSRPRR